jgi:hypothetical protein
MPLGWIAAATAVTGIAGANAASNAADAQAKASRDAARLQKDQYDQTREDQAPWRAAGEQALNKLIPLSDYTKFGMDQFQADPGYAFRLAEGQKALDRSAAARGGLISGAALKAAGRYGQEMGSQEYQNAFNRYQTERNAALNPLQSLAGLGQTATNQVSAAGQNYANSTADAYASAANARASGYVGGANALNSAVGNIGNMYMQNKYMTQRYPTGSSGVGYAPAGNPMAVGEYADPGYWT